MEDQLPAHSCLELIANSEQVLSNYTSRRLLTYKKIKEPEVYIYVYICVNYNKISLIFNFASRKSLNKK